MAQRPGTGKNWLDVAIDFFFGAMAGMCVGWKVFFYSVGDWEISGHFLVVLAMAAAAIGGSLAAICRNEFWKLKNDPSIIPLPEEQLSSGQIGGLVLVLAIGFLLPVTLVWWR